MNTRSSIILGMTVFTFSASLAQTTPRKPHITSDEMGTTRVLEQPNPTHGVFEMKLTGADGQPSQWHQYFKDVDGKILIQVTRNTVGHDENPPYEGVQFITHYTYLPNGNVSTVHEYLGDGRLRRKTVYRYDEFSRFVRGEIFRDGKKVGYTSTPPTDFMYGAKQKAEPGAAPNGDPAAPVENSTVTEGRHR